MPGAAITYEVGLDGANAAIVDSGRVQLGLIHSGLGQMAVQGEYPYEKKLDNVRGISLVYSNSALHFVVNAKTGLTSLEQIKQQKYPLRVSVIYRGSMMEIASKAVLEAYGITYRDIESWGGKVYFRALQPSLELMKDDRLDAISLVVQFPETNLNEASLRQSFRLLPLSEQVIERINQQLGTYKSEIPAGTYRFTPQAVATFSDSAILIGYAGMSDDLVYQITGALFRNIAYLHTVHRALSKLQPPDMPQVGHLPLHPGAARFYREASLLP
ncbi:MAG: hypothetical protein A3H27_17435 [Acidobacteria bacterium RIFCSPLOWO2_02_FULL_59_13]|nr:MAG: hypothetical protein A3H27_17435 [Acidobacteria bacterium RIFCSPLOWO2_02_FULL_59_13]